MANDSHYAALLAVTRDEDLALAARYAPVIRFDMREPFLPLAAGYTVFRSNAPSPSFPRQIDLSTSGQPTAALVIEYAIWWDWDIGHLYELEHVWVYIGAAGELLRVEASWHGGMHPMERAGGFERQGSDHPVVYSEPGKHAFAPEPNWFTRHRAPHERSDTGALAGMGGLLVTPLFEGLIDRSAYADTLARTYLARHAFTPSMKFDQRFRFTAEQLVPWPALLRWIPERMAWWIERLEQEIPQHEYRYLRIGHRGAAAHAPDNSLEGVEAALHHGADMVEIDLRVTGDGILVAVHDSHLRDSSGVLLEIAATPFETLRAIDLGGGAHVRTLDEIVARCSKHRLGLYLELKESAAIEPMLACLRTNDYDDVIVGSFRPDWLADLKAAEPQITISVLFSSPHINAIALADACSASYVHPCWRQRSERPDQLLTLEWIAWARTAGLGIITWNEERPEVIDGLRQIGVDGICSDRPELLR